MNNIKKVVDYTYRLEELVDDIGKSIETTQNVINQEKLLVRVLNDSDESEKFENFIKETNQQIDGMERNLETLKDRRTQIQHVIELTRNESTKETAVETLCCVLEGLGILKRADREDAKQKSEE